MDVDFGALVDWSRARAQPVDELITIRSWSRLEERAVQDQSDVPQRRVLDPRMNLRSGGDVVGERIVRAVSTEAEAVILQKLQLCGDSWVRVDELREALAVDEDQGWDGCARGANMYRSPRLAAP